MSAQALLDEESVSTFANSPTAPPLAPLGGASIANSDASNNPTSPNGRTMTAASPPPHKGGDGNSPTDDDDYDDDYDAPPDLARPKVLTDYDKQRVRLENIVDVLNNDCDKMRHFAFLPVYFLLLLCIFLVLLWHRADLDEDKSQIHYGKIISKIANASIISSMADSEEARGPNFFVDNVVTLLRNLVRDYIETDVGTVWILPLCMLRQVRVENVACWTGSAFFSDSRVSVNGSLPTCPGGWDNSVNAKDFSIFKRNSNADLDLIAVSTPVNSFDQPLNEFYAPLNMQNSSTFEADLNRTLQNGFVDSFTRGMVADVVFSFPNSGVVLIMSMYWITTDGGLIITNTQMRIFSLFTLSRGVMSIDSVVLFLAVVLMVVSVLEVYDNFGRIDEKEWHSLKKITTIPRVFLRVISPWQIITFITLGLIFAITIIRFNEWARDDQFIAGVPQTPYPTQGQLLGAYGEAVRSASTFRTTYELYGYAFMLMTYRFGYAAQYLSKLSLVARTLRESTPDLMRVFNVFWLSLVVFSLIFHAIFGQTIASMRTLFRTVIVLVRMIISGDADPEDYLAMRQGTYSIGADVLLTVFYILFWLLLLNFVLAIISAAFMNSYTDVRSADTVMNVIRTYVLFNAPMYYVDRFHRPDDLSKMGGCRRAASAALSVPPPYITRLKLLFSVWRWRVSSLNKLKNLQKKIVRDRLDPTVARHELAGLMPLDDSHKFRMLKNLKNFFRGKSAGQPVSFLSPEERAAQKEQELLGGAAAQQQQQQQSVEMSSKPSFSSPTTSSATDIPVSPRAGAGAISPTSPIITPMTPGGTSRSRAEMEARYLARKAMNKDRAKEAGKRAVAFLVNELFDAVQLREMAEASVALDKHALTMKKLNKCTERIKFIISAERSGVGNLTPGDLNLRSGDFASMASFGTFSGGKDAHGNSLLRRKMSSHLRRNHSGGDAGGGGGSSSKGSGSSSSLSVSAVGGQQQQQQQQNQNPSQQEQHQQHTHSSGGHRQHPHRRGSVESDGADSDIQPDEIDTANIEQQIALRRRPGGSGSNLSTLSSDTFGSFPSQSTFGSDPSRSNTNTSFAGSSAMPSRSSFTGGGSGRIRPKTVLFADQVGAGGGGGGISNHSFTDPNGYLAPVPAAAAAASSSASDLHGPMKRSSTMNPGESGVYEMEMQIPDQPVQNVGQQSNNDNNVQRSNSHSLFHNSATADQINNLNAALAAMDSIDL